jgi:hypothetical protein
VDAEIIDGDGSRWVLMSDKTYRIRKGNGRFSARWHSYSKAQIRKEFGIRSEEKK